MRACGSSRNVSLPETEKFRSRIVPALNAARASGAELLSVAFPPLPESAFAALASAESAARRFHFEDFRTGTALAAWDFRAAPPIFFARGISSFKKNLPARCARLALDNSAEEKSVPAPKIFIAGAFEKNAFSRAEIPVWQISREGGATRISAQIFLAGTPAAERVADSLTREFSVLRELAGTSLSRVAALPKISPCAACGDDDFASYCGNVARAVAAIRAGKFRKIVLARAKDFSFSPEENFPEGAFISALRERFSASGCTIFRVPAEFPETPPEGASVLVGATPETLLRISSGQLFAEALAGTFPRNAAATASEDSAAEHRFFADEKERSEHAFVVDFIAEKLRAHGLRPQISEVPEVLRLPNVFHLRTPISASVPAGLGAAEIADALHPTPAMCGVPADAAERFIVEAEPFLRERFSAPVGFFDASGDGQFAVAIRCAKIGRGTLRLYAGAGIVADSVPAAEFAETEAKMRALRLGDS